MGEKCICGHGLRSHHEGGYCRGGAGCLCQQFTGAPPPPAEECEHPVTRLAVGTKGDDEALICRACDKSVARFTAHSKGLAWALLDMAMPVVEAEPNTTDNAVVAELQRIIDIAGSPMENQEYQLGLTEAYARQGLRVLGAPSDD